MQGWISIHRQIKDNWIWDDKPFSKGQAWIDILLRVNHKPKKVPLGNQIVPVESGQTIWSIKDMANSWGWSRKKVDNFLKMLEKDEMLHNKRTSKYTLLTVANWAMYQGGEHQKEQQKNINGTSKEHQKNTNNNDNNKKNENKEVIESIWLAYPMKKGKASAIKKIPKLLKEYSVDELLNAIKRYDKSVTDKNYLMHGSTFFNGGYMDYIGPEEKPKNTGMHSNVIYTDLSKTGASDGSLY